MPWTSSDAKKFTSKAGNGSQWSAVANNVLKTTGDDGKAVRIANGVVKQSKPSFKGPTGKVSKGK